MIRMVGKIYSASPSADVPSSAPKIRRMTPGMNAHERVLPPGRTATRIKVSPSPRKKNPPPISPLKSASNAETAPSVSNTPPGMMAHQRSVLVKYTHQKARLMPAKKTSPSMDESAGGRIDCAARPSRVKAGKAAHQLLRSLNNIYRKRAPPAAKIKPQKMPPEFEITFIASSSASTPPKTKSTPSHKRGSNRFILFSFLFHRHCTKTCLNIDLGAVHSGIEVSRLIHARSRSWKSICIHADGRHAFLHSDARSSGVGDANADGSRARLNVQNGGAAGGQGHTGTTG